MNTSPPRQDAWHWRLVATGMAFTLFGLGGLVLRLVVFPLQRLLPADAAAQRSRARATIHWAFRLFVRFMVGAGILKIEFVHGERLGRPGQMIIANHPSLLDVVFLIAQIKDANCIVRHGLAVNRFTRAAVCHAGYVTNDESVDMFDRAAESLRDGETLIVFPEGTRTPPDSMPTFHRGACAIALRGARMVTPVVIHMNPRSLGKGEPWYRVPYRRMHYRIVVGDSLDPAQWESRYPRPIAGRKMNEHLHHYFQQELKNE
jgi:1-acyl-sn-glycerol-3-phosphate acyltransferase